MPVICLGPVCVPISAFIPGLLFLWSVLKRMYELVLRVSLGGVGTSASMRKEWIDVAEQNFRDGQAMEIEAPGHWDCLVKYAKSSNIVFVLMFTATWCGPCKAAYPEFEGLSKQYGGDALFLFVDADRCPGVASHFGITAYPTFVVVQNCSGQPSRVLGILRGIRDGISGLENFVGPKILLGRAPSAKKAL